MKLKTDLKSQIEQLVQERKTQAAKKLIVQRLRESSSSDRVFEATQWYRRLSLYKDSLRLIMSQFPFDPTASREIKILAAETLSILGSTPYALQIVENIEPKTSDEFEIFAGIYFSANNYEKALNYFQKRVALAENSRDYQIRLARLSCADCYAHLNQFQEAIDICDVLIEESKETLFVSICKQAKGEYLARLGKFKEALKILVEAETTFPGRAETYDHALLYRWLGFAYIKTGRLVLGKKYLERSTRIIKKTGLREEIWLENVKLAHNLGILSKGKSQRLEFYPGLPAEFFGPQKNKGLELGREKSQLKIYFSSDEFFLNGSYYLGIPLEIKLLGYLRIVEEWGIGFELAKSLLWPNEGHSYFFLESRLRQMLKRIKRRYKIRIQVTNSRMSLNNRDLKKISVIIDTLNLLPKCLRNEAMFNREQLMKFYHLKKTQATVWLEKLLSQGLILRESAGRSTKYKVLKRKEDEDVSFVNALKKLKN